MNEPRHPVVRCGVKMAGSMVTGLGERLCPSVHKPPMDTRNGCREADAGCELG